MLCLGVPYAVSWLVFLMLYLGWCSQCCVVVFPMLYLGVPYAVSWLVFPMLYLGWCSLCFILVGVSCAVLWLALTLSWLIFLVLCD